MKEIHFNLKPNDLTFGKDINEELRSISENFQDVAGSATMFKKTLDLEINTEQLIIDGSNFTPPITVEPSLYKALKIDGGNISDVSDVIEGFTKNGIYYDVIINPLEDQILNVKITII